MTENMTIQEACDAIDYNPNPDAWENKTDAQKWSAIKSKRIERAVRDAKNVLADFVSSAAYGSLDASIQEAISTIAVKRTGGGGGGGVRKNVFMDTMSGFLSEIGDSVDELEIFKALKMGRGEVRAKVRENLKKADPDNRIWIELVDEEWTLIGVGANQPEAWTGNPIDED